MHIFFELQLFMSIYNKKNECVNNIKRVIITDTYTDKHTFSTLNVSDCAYEFLLLNKCDWNVGQLCNQSIN